ncbi:UNVERIFIED_CONTAM: hypothetical protein Sradi_3987400 [Sesamum radiatum]|uniref:Uncharacterized protein n=1 Tax=Sesamum radiatum TaxID=300843 RepID=A0AAW2PJL7_SESRA
MSALVWNCGGLGSALTVQKLCECAHEWGPKLVFLSETKCSQKRFERVRECLNMFGVCVLSVGRAGGLVLLWNKEIVVQLRSFSANHIAVDILGDESVANWRFTGFYGEPEASRRTQI